MFTFRLTMGVPGEWPQRVPKNDLGSLGRPWGYLAHPFVSFRSFLEPLLGPVCGFFGAHVGSLDHPFVSFGSFGDLWGILGGPFGMFWSLLECIRDPFGAYWEMAKPLSKRA